MEPRELVEGEAFNRADVDALADFDAEDVTTQQVAEEPIVGRDTGSLIPGLRGTGAPCGRGQFRPSYRLASWPPATRRL